MSQEKFEVKPVKAYSGATYFAAPVEESEVEERQQPHPMAVALMFLLVLGLTLGLVGCYMRTEHSEEPPDATPDGGLDGDPPPPPPPPPECDESELRCLDGGDIEVCQDEEWVVQSCHERCVDALGPMAYSEGCDADADDPCLCDYEMLDGVAVECTPDQVVCLDDDMVEVCQDGMPLARNCDDVCHEQLGPNSHSEGCDATDADDPCQCEYDMIDGGESWCTPEDVVCHDDGSVELCLDGGMTVEDCNSWCTTTRGPEYFSTGCDESDPADPCQCAYSIPDGGPVACNPGDVACVEDGTLATCSDSYEWVNEDCDSRCLETHGPGHHSEGCDASNPDDPCTCSSDEE